MPMQVQLSPEAESIVRALVETGEYVDQDAVITEAIGQAQIERGEYVLLTPELRDAIRREARQMVVEGRAPNPDVLP